MSGPSLLLLHGLGATPGVWRDLEAGIEWPGRIITPTLPGHGNGPWTGDYTLGSLAAAVSAACEPAEPVVIGGHSLGGAVGLCLASGLFRPDVIAVVGIGVKVRWSDDDVAGMAKVAQRGVRWFESRTEAVERYLRQAGLDGLVDHDHEAVVDAVAEDDGRWRVSQDPMTFAQRPVDTAGLLSAARCRVVLGAGSGDAMSSEEDLGAFVDEPRIAEGRGHNVQVEDPGWVIDLLREVGG